MSEKKNINYTNNDGAKYRYSAPRDTKNSAKPKPEKVKQALTKRAVLWKTNKAFAIIILVAVVLLFSTFSLWRTVYSKSGAVEKYYENIKTYAAKMTSSAKSLASLCEATNPDSTLYTETRDIISDLEKCYDTPFWRDTSLASRLYDNSEAMFNLIIYGNNSVSLSTAASDDARGYFNEITSNYYQLGPSEKYTDAANKYNKAISKFPLSVLGKDRAPIFENFDGEYSEYSDGGSGLSGLISSLGLNISHVIVIAVIVLFVILLSAAQRGTKKK